MLGSRVKEMDDEKLVSEDFVHILVREALTINSNVEESVVRKAVEVGGLSWEMMESQAKEVLVEKLKAIELLDEPQCNALFDKINGMRPTELQRKKRDYMLTVIRSIYENWIMKCMYSVSECFAMTIQLLCLCQCDQKVNPQDVGGKDIMDNIKSDIEKLFENVRTTNMICYCQQPLSEYNSKSVQSKYQCRLCQKSFGYRSYDCNNKSCIYKTVTAMQFWICPSCYEQGEYIDINLDFTEDEWKKIFVSKLKSDISAISYVTAHVILFAILKLTH